MAGRQVLALVILVRIQVPEPRKSTDAKSVLFLVCGRRFNQAPEPIVLSFRHRGVFESKSPSQDKKSNLVLGFYFFGNQERTKFP